MKNKWVIVFLIYADFRKDVENNPKNAFAMTEQMKAELNSMFKDILTVPIDSKRARMYVLMNGIDYKEGDEAATEAKTLFYEIGNPGNLDYNQITSWDVISDPEGTADEPNPNNPFQKTKYLKRNLKI